MTLEAVIQDKTKIPAGLEAHYVEIDGAFVLDVPGMKTQSDFDKYAAALKKRFADSSADFAKQNGAGLSRDEVLEVMETALQKFAPPNNGGNGGGGEPGDDVKARLHDLERNVASLTATNEDLVKERDTALSTSRDTTITNSLIGAAATAGATPEGVPNLVKLVKDVFEVAQDGTVVTKLDAGEGVSPNMKPEDYFANIARDKAYRPFWPASKGGGADNGSGGGGGGGGDLGKSNPWSKAGWNMTEQGRIFQSNREEANRLMETAGVTLGATEPVR